jgi:hypothetical protein
VLGRAAEGLTSGRPKETGTGRKFSAAGEKLVEPAAGKYLVNQFIHPDGGEGAHGSDAAQRRRWAHRLSVVVGLRIFERGAHFRRPTAALSWSGRGGRTDHHGRYHYLRRFDQQLSDSDRGAPRQHGRSVGRRDGHLGAGVVCNAARPGVGAGDCRPRGCSTVDGVGAFRAGLETAGQIDSLRSLSGGRRFLRRHRVADRVGRDPHGYRGADLTRDLAVLCRGAYRNCCWD